MNPTSEDWEAFAREERERAGRARMQEGRVSEPLAAIFAAVAVEGVNSLSELMEKRGLTTVPDLLASLGFTGDLDGLTREIEASVSEMRRRQGGRGGLGRPPHRLSVAPFAGY